MYHNVFNVWPKTTLLPVWRRDAKKLDTPASSLKTQNVFPGLAAKKRVYPVSLFACSEERQHQICGGPCRKQ